MINEFVTFRESGNLKTGARFAEYFGKIKSSHALGHELAEQLKPVLKQRTVLRINAHQEIMMSKGVKMLNKIEAEVAALQAAVVS